MHLSFARRAHTACVHGLTWYSVQVAAGGDDAVGDMTTARVLCNFDAADSSELSLVADEVGLN